MPTGDPYRRVRAGEPMRIQASAWNALLGILADSQTVGGSLNPAGRGAPLPTADVIRVQNTSGVALATRFCVLGIDGVAITPVDNEASFLAMPVLKGITGVVGTHDSAFVVLSGPVAVDGVVLGYVGGVFPAYVEITSATHTCAKLKAATTSKLISGSAGPARILARAASTGTSVLCLVALGLAGSGAGGPSFGKITSKVSGTTYLCSIYDNGYRVAATATGLTVDVENTLSAETLAAGTRVLVRLLPAGTYEGEVLGAQLT